MITISDYAGCKVPKDDEKARELLSQAIEHGFPNELYPRWVIDLKL